MRRTIFIAVLGAVFLVGASIAAYSLGTGGPTASDQRPNVVMVIGCTLRKDQISAYGGHRAASPFLGKMAKKGVMFLDAFDAAPWTKAASTALMTGQHPISIGMIEPMDHGNRRLLSQQVTTLGEHFKGAGYSTFGLTANPNTSAVFGFDQGFDEYYDEPLWRNNGMDKVPGREMVDRALEMLVKKKPNVPFYLQLMLVDTHSPVTVKTKEREKYVLEGEPKRLADYRAMLKDFDSAVARLHRKMSDKSNTYFIVVNDHGEGLNWPEHHGKGHGRNTYPSAVSMPWLMMGPNIPANHSISGIASQVDVVPTILGLLGIDGYEGPGQNWSSSVLGETNQTTRERA